MLALSSSSVVSFFFLGYQLFDCAHRCQSSSVLRFLSVLGNRAFFYYPYIGDGAQLVVDTDWQPRFCIWGRANAATKSTDFFLVAAGLPTDAA